LSVRRFFGSPAFWGVGFVWGYAGTGLVFVAVAALFPKGFALWTPTMGLLAPLTPRQRLARRCTPRFLFSRFTFVHSFTFAPRTYILKK